MTIRPSAEPVVESRAMDEEQVHRLNVSVAALGVILTAPLMLMIALAVRLTSRGPVIFRQTRIGLDRRTHANPAHGERRTNAVERRAYDMGGRPFTMYKFRTMRADWGSSQVWASLNDARVTALGRILRRYRLDELPQLFNVIAGDMHVVGPRPEQPDLFETLRAEIDKYPIRQRVLPGITGWAQVNLPYDSSLQTVINKLEYDLEYLNHRSPREDLRIMAKTLPVMLSMKGAR